MDLTRRAAFVLILLTVPFLASAQPPPVAQSASLTSAVCPGAGCLTVTVAGYGSVGVQVTGTWAGTITFRGSVDRSTFSAINCTPPNSTTPVTSTTANGLWTCDVSSLGQMRAVVTAYTSGTAVVTVQASPSSTARGQAPAGSGGTASGFGAAFPANGTAAGFIGDTGNLTGATLDSSGFLKVNCSTGCSGAADTTVTGALAANAASTSMAMAGTNGSSVTFGASTYSLATTITPQVSKDGGTTWSSAVFLNAVSGAVSTTLSSPASAQYQVFWPGSATHVRLSSSNSGASGSVDYTLKATQSQNTTVVAGSDGTNVRPVTVTSAGLVKVDLSGTAANGTAVKVDGSAVTQPVSAASLPLPTGASTAAKQPALGTAGTAATDVISVQGIASMTALKVDGSGVTQPVSGTVTANAGTNLNTSALALEAGGNLATVKTNTDPLVASGGGGYVRQDSTATIAKETGGNLATVKTNTDPLVASGGGGYVRQDSTATIAKESGGNLATIATNTTGVATAANQTTGNASLATIATNTAAELVSSAGAYVRQDTTGSIAKETGGNLDALVRSLSTLIADLHSGRVTVTGSGSSLNLRGTFNEPIRSVGGALRVAPDAPSLDPCFAGKKGSVAISQTASTKLVAGLSGKVIYVCYARVVAGAAEIPSLLEGLGAACATSTIAVSGSTTAANGESYAANGGFSGGTGLGTIAVTKTPGFDLCLGQSGANRLSGNISFLYGDP